MIVTADHGEELGEHGLFEHGESLYRPEIRVPLLIVSPPADRSPGVVREAVSLRDLPATIVDLVGLAAGAPFPGRSLARFWRDPALQPRALAIVRRGRRSHLRADGSEPDQSRVTADRPRLGAR